MRLPRFLSILAAGLTVVVAVAARPADPPKGRKVAFLVGVGTYKHGLPGLGPAPVKDVTELAGVLRAGGFEVTILTDAAATRAEVDRRFRAVLAGGGDARHAVGDGDVLLVALCGHGFQADVTDAAGVTASEPFFAPYDARLAEDGLNADTATLVPLNGLIRAANTYGATTLFLVDACRSLPLDPNRGRTRAGIQGGQATLRKNVAVLFACGQGQVSHQNEELGHGLFTYSVLRVLRGETGLTGEVTWDDLVAGVRKEFRGGRAAGFIPRGKPQAPVVAAGELRDTTLLAVGQRGTVGKKEEPRPPTPSVAGEATGDLRARRDAGAAPADKAKLVIHVPTADARLMLEGQPTKVGGLVREFDTPPLSPGKVYAYAVEVTWQADDKTPRRAVGELAVQAGDKYIVTVAK